MSLSNNEAVENLQERWTGSRLGIRKRASMLADNAELVYPPSPELPLRLKFSLGCLNAGERENRETTERQKSAAARPPTHPNGCFFP